MGLSTIKDLVGCTFFLRKKYKIARSESYSTLDDAKKKCEISYFSHFLIVFFFRLEIDEQEAVHALSLNNYHRQDTGDVDDCSIGFYLWRCRRVI